MVGVMRMRWHDLQELQAVCQVDAPLLEWLSYTGSTTQRMRDVFGRDVSVVLLPESPFPGMVLSHFSSLGGRHVALYADARIWMLASSYFTPELPASQLCSDRPMGVWSSCSGSYIREDVCFAIVPYSTLCASCLPPGGREVVVRRSRMDLDSVSVDLFEVFFSL